MNEPSTSPIIMGLLFVLRCLIPLGILFGISYLLRRLEVFADQADEAENAAPEPMPESTEGSLPAQEEKKLPPKKPKIVKKKKTAAPKKRSRKQ